jgi:hypothetical protein
MKYQSPLKGIYGGFMGRSKVLPYIEIMYHPGRNPRGKSIINVIFVFQLWTINALRLVQPKVVS